MTSLSSAQDMLDYAPHATLLRIVDRKVLLLEARDRVGGRTYTVEGDEDGTCP
ncbi:unnamed protein product [Penicillium manginii]